MSQLNLPHAAAGLAAPQPAWRDAGRWAEPCVSGFFAARIFPPCGLRYHANNLALPQGSKSPHLSYYLLSHFASERYVANTDPPRRLPRRRRRRDRPTLQDLRRRDRSRARTSEASIWGSPWWESKWNLRGQPRLGLARPGFGIRQDQKAAAPSRIPSPVGPS
jgi:hypothetical protein